MRPLSRKQRDALANALVGRPEVARDFIVSVVERPTLVFEYDERPPTRGAAQRNIQELVSEVASALGRGAGKLGFLAGAPEDVADLIIGGDVVFERR